MKLLPLLLALVGTGCVAHGEPAIEKIRLFSAGDADYTSYRIPAIVVTPQKTVLVAAEGRKNSRSDWGHIDLFYRRSLDSGRTWEAPRPLVKQEDLPTDMAWNEATTQKAPRPRGFTISNATWVADAKGGKTFFIFCAEYMRCFIIESSDGGDTFTRPREITSAFDAFKQRDDYQWKVIATGPGHGVQLSTGRLVVPIWISTADGSNAHHPSVCGTIYSDDGGGTWSAGEIAAGRKDGVVDPSETAVVEIATGKVMLNIRNESSGHRRATVVNADGATGWSKPSFHEKLWEPVCMASIVKLPDGALVFSNPVSLDLIPNRPNVISRDRKNLGVRISRDQGKTWSEPVTLEAGPSAYSDLAVAPDGTILCFYEHGEKSPYNAMSVARIPVTVFTK